MNAAASKQEIIHAEPAPLAAVTPMTLIDRALTTGASPEIIEKFMALQARWDANQARKQFDVAIAEAKGEIKPIVRSRAGHNSKLYVDFAAIAREVDPILKKHGLAYRFRTTQDDRIHVTCILFGHGHSEESSLSGPPDKTGSKNDIQAIGSTLTYLQRYSLVQMLGLASADDDDGAAGEASGNVSDDQRDELLRMIDETGADIQRFCAFFKVEGVALLPAKRFDEAKAKLKKFGQAPKGAAQ